MLWVLIRIASEAILMSAHNIGFYEDLTKIIFELSSNTHLISSADFKTSTEAFNLLQNFFSFQPYSRLYEPRREKTGL